MRTLELVLLIALVLALVIRIARRQRGKRWSRFTGYLPSVILLLHWILEGYRWQLLPAYAVSGILLAVQLVDEFRRADFERPLSRALATGRVTIIVIGVTVVGLAGFLAVALPVFHLPEPTGPYPVSTTRINFTDYSRPDEHASHPGSYRRIPIRIWYPAAESSGPGAPYLEPAEAEALAVRYTLPSFFFDHLSLVETHSGSNAPPAEGQLPLVFYSPSGFVSQATAMCEDLASHGYVVAAINHAYWNAYTRDTTGTVVVNDRHNAYYRQMWQEELSDQTEWLKNQITRAVNHDLKLELHRELTKSLPTEVRDICEWAQDVSFVIDHLEQDQSGATKLSHIVDLSRIGIIGFSKGGAAAGQACLDDPRISAGVNLDGFMFGDIVDSAVPCPFMFVHGEPFLPEAYINDVFYEGAPDKSILMKMRGARHADFSDLPLFGSLIAGQDAFGTIAGLRVTTVLNAYVLAFLNRALKGTYESLLACPSGEIPEVELRSKAGLEDVEVLPLSGLYLGQEPPGREPRLFAPGVVPVDGIQHCFPTFSPDGRELYWLTVQFEDGRPRGQIWYMREVDGIWGKPRIAPFSGDYSDHAPFMSADGSRLYFSSSRPGGYGSVKNIWYVDRTERGWSEAQNLGSPPNTELGASQATFTSDGTVYFVGAREGTQWNTGIYRSRFVNGQYLPPEPLPAPISTSHADVYPFIAPDESYLLFGSSRPGARSSETDLYISFRSPDDAWSEPIQLDESINNGKTVSFSFVTHDGKYLFFNRFDEGGTDKFFWVDAAVLDGYRQKSLGNNRDAQEDRRLFAQLGRITDSCRTASAIVGISAAVVWQDGQYWTGTSGQSSIDDVLNDGMLFGIGSATKTYVAALILKYVELGMLNLDNTIDAWLEFDRFDLNRITVRQLLNHTSGLYNYMAHPDYNLALYTHPDTLWTVDALLNSFMIDLDAEPGRQWEYSAANYLLLGKIIERVSGHRASEELRTRFFEPLGLENTFLYPQELYETDRMAHLWMVIDSTETPMDLNLLVGHPPHRGLFSSVWTAGAIHATALDAAKWLSALAQGKVIRKSSVVEMTKPTPLSGTVKYGLGIMSEEIDGTVAIGHSGGIGYSSLVLYFPEDSVSIAVLCNSEADPKPVVSALYRAALNRGESN